MIEVVCNDRLGKKVRVKCTQFSRTMCHWQTMKSMMA
uniref:Ubiquitin-like protein 5 n=1 Tax=Anolis carolinensis TaxID=28377 RepID=A0A803TA86_ANOCA